MPKPGQDAPALDLPDDTGRRVRLADLRGRWVVVFFYPADETPFCTQEACEFRDLAPEFDAAGAVLLGVSMDDAKAHAAFKKRHRLPFALLADTEGVAARDWGTGGLFGHPKRVTFVVDPEGRIADAYESQVRAKNHAHRALEVVQKAVEQTA